MGRDGNATTGLWRLQNKSLAERDNRLRTLNQHEPVLISAGISPGCFPYLLKRRDGEYADR